MSAPRARILYIDDDPSLCRLVQKDLERQGYDVEIAADGASGLARIAQGGKWRAVPLVTSGLGQ
jgi:CheY-like chemotaxis protein